MNKIIKEYKEYFSYLGEGIGAKWWVFLLATPMFIYLGMKVFIAVVVVYGGALLIIPLLALPIESLVNSSIDKEIERNYENNSTN